MAATAPKAGGSAPEAAGSAEAPLQYSLLLQYLVGDKRQPRLLEPGSLGGIPSPAKSEEQKMIERAMESCAFKAVLACVGVPGKVGLEEQRHQWLHHWRSHRLPSWSKGRGHRLWRVCCFLCCNRLLPTVKETAGKERGRQPPSELLCGAVSTHLDCFRGEAKCIPLQLMV
ncbi:mitochondrial import inner membrane translocase subunit Tim22 isoform 2 [Mus musculus]|nr:mitochondrial import inner membrane translocase subunit Tim22 isoform 2 [Mus musculus]|eukprot:NP_075844.1 mitochondrial import inner membrane translocase subunit Tim22 isoform 2 [Mus musculus]